jgi:signal transduction histidine kinase
MANMSHELRTPLNSVIGFSDVLLSGLSGPLTDEQQRQMQMIRDSGRHLLDLVDEVLDLSRIETGGDRIDVDTFDAAATVSRAVRSLEPAAEHKGVTLSYELPASVMMRSDERKLRQIVLNIVGNAVKFTDVGAVTVMGRVLRDKFVISVSDTGPGIAAEHVDRIFHEFWQVSSSDHGKPQGAGLGLAIALRMAEALGGTISVHSEVGSGSTFEIVIPLAAPAEGSPAKE